VLIALTLLPGRARAQACAVDLFREHDPAHPPLILIAPAIRQIATSPHLDSDVPPAGTGLTFYRVNMQTSDPDPLVPLILLTKIGEAPLIDWGGLPATDRDGDTTPDCSDPCPDDPFKVFPGACGCGVTDIDRDADAVADCIDGCPDDASALAPAACCVSLTCTTQCPSACAAAGGNQRPGESCADLPPPCGAPPGCPTPGPFTGMAAQPGGGTVLTSYGLPATNSMDLHDVDSGSGASTLRALTLTTVTQRTWNFTGARDPAAGSHHYIGGRADQPAVGTHVVTVDVVGASLAADMALAPQVNVAHVDFDHRTATLYGLIAEAPGISLGQHFSFNNTLALARIDPATGAVTTIATGLPAGLDHYAATLDSEGGRYFYHVATGLLHAVDLATGAVTSVSEPADIADLQFDDATGTLYGLRFTGNSGISGSDATGWVTNGAIDLVLIDPATGGLTVLNTSPLPAGMTNWASAFDCESRHYAYVSGDGNTRVLDVTTGALVATGAPPASSRHWSLD
jgi:hypothetical protein